MPTESSELARKLARRASAYFNSPFGDVEEHLGQRLSEAGLADLENEHNAKLHWVDKLEAEKSDLETKLEAAEKAKLGFIVELDEMSDKLKKIADITKVGQNDGLWAHQIREIHRLATEGEKDEV